MTSLLVHGLLLLSLNAAAQEPQPQTPPAETKPDKPEQKGPEVRYNYINVCNPNDADKSEIAAALGRIPAKPRFTDDFEVTRGRTSLENAGSARYLRLRREMSGDTPFATAQYSLSSDQEKTIEVLVLKMKDPKELFTVSVEDQVSSSAAAPSSVLDVNTPASRIKLERFGKSNLVLARCEAGDQSLYEPLFQQASAILSGYRKALGLRSIFRQDIAWLSPAATGKPPAKPKDKKKQ